MSITETVPQLKMEDLKKYFNRLREMLKARPVAGGLVFLGILMSFNLLSLNRGKEGRIIESTKVVSFQNGRILNDREGTFYRGKEKLLSQKAQSLIDSQSKLETRIAELEKKLETQANQNTTANQQSISGVPSGSQTALSTTTNSTETPIQLYPSTMAEEQRVDLAASPNRKNQKGGGHVLIKAKGPDVISFPVKSDVKGQGVVLPAGSYVKAKILTGVDVPEGRTYPVLMVLDYSYVAPNDHKIDLSGCFMIAKAEGDLSTERVQMQPTKMSCVSKHGKMFERAVKGFVADDKDNSFAMQGKVQSKQGRVASMAFLASVIEGVGKAVQATQTTQSTNAFGGTQSAMTGDAEKYVVAGGAANAASMVAQWYLKQAQNLAPTVSVGSGRDVWIVMSEKVSLPEEYFKKEGVKGNEGIYSYFTRVLD